MRLASEGYVARPGGERTAALSLRFGAGREQGASTLDSPRLVRLAGGAG